MLSVYVTKLEKGCLNNIHENATDYVNSKTTNVILDIMLYKILRREIPKWNGSSCGARFFQRGFPPLESPRRALPFEPAPQSVGQIFAKLIALILVLTRALITRIYVFVKKFLTEVDYVK